METSIISMNVRGLGQKQKRLQVFQWVIEQKSTIYMLQETHLTKNDIDQWKTDWQGDIIFSGSQLNSEGVCILFNPKYKIKVRKCKRTCNWKNNHLLSSY